MQVTIVKRGDNVFCQGVERMIPVHPDHLKYFEDNVGNVVEIELKQLADDKTFNSYIETYAVPKVDEWKSLDDEDIYLLVDEHLNTIWDKHTGEINEDDVQRWLNEIGRKINNHYLKHHYRITKKS